VLGRSSTRGNGVREAPARSTNVTLRNLTARRIGIAALDPDDVELIVPPFGERTLGADELARHDYREWEAHRLVSIAPDVPARGDTGPAAATAAAFCGTTALAALSFTAAVFFTGNGLWLLLALAAAALTLVVGSLARWRAEVRARILRSWAIFVVTVIAVGLPLWAAFENYWEPKDRGLMLLLVVLASVAAGLPGALYFLFQRQKLPTLRETFVRDLVRLDPNVQTTPDAENAYGSLIEEAYGSGSGGLASGRVPIFLTTFLLAGFWVWVLGDVGEAGLMPGEHVVAFAFLGSYVFAINMVFRRYTRGDLGPKAYTHIIVRTLIAVTSTWAVSYVPGLQGDGTAQSILFLLAFFVGVVPETGTAVVQDVLQKQKLLGSIPSVGERHPVSKLNGISLYDATHLLEAGIENVEGLAHHRMVDLMLWTRMPTSRLVDLVDQAILYLHVRGPVDLSAAAGPDDDADEFEDGARMLLCRYGIRTATDLERAVARAAGRSGAEVDRLLDLLPGSPSVRRLGVVLDAMEDDEWLSYVRNWRESNSASPVVHSVREFAEVARRDASLPSTRGGTARAAHPAANGSGRAPARRISVVPSAH
jgi:MFS family permease